MAGDEPRARAAAEWGLLLAALFAVAAIRRLGWDHWSLWLDEAMQARYAGQGLRDLWSAVVADRVHPPLDVLGTWLVSRVSRSDAALRLPALLWSVGTAAALFARCGGFRRFRPALGAVAAFAVLPLAVNLGQEVRPYSLALFLLATADAARHSFVRTGSRKALALSVLAGTALAWTLYLGLFALAGIWLVEIAASRGQGSPSARRRAAILVPGLVLAAFTPWLAVLARGERRPAEMPAPHVTARLLASYAGSLATGRAEDGARPAALLVWALSAAGLAAADREERLRTGVELAVSTAGVLGFLLAVDHWWGLRYLAMALLPLARSVGLGLDAAARRVPLPSGPAWAVLASLLVASEAPGLLENARTGRPDWKRPARYLEFQRNGGRGGPVLAADPWSFLVLDFQASRLPVPLEVVLAAAPDELAREMGRRGSGWVVRTPHHPAPPEIDALLGASRPWSESAEAEQARLYRFEGGRLCPP